MRALIAALSLIPLALILAGCGGGGGGGAKCNNEQMQMVSQSVKLTGNVEQVVSEDGSQEPTKTPVTIEWKIDMEYMRIYERVQMEVVVPDPLTPAKPTKQVSVDVRVMFDAQTKKAAIGIISDYPSMPLGNNNCSYLMIPWLKSPEDLSQCVKDGFAKEGMAPPKVPNMEVSGPTCTADGDLDEWKVSFKNDTIPEMKMSGEECWKVDKNSVMQEMMMEVKVNGKVTTAGTLTAAEPTKTSGPSEDDMNFQEKWGFNECKEYPLGPGPGATQLEFFEVMRKVVPQSHLGAVNAVPLLMNAKSPARRLQPGGMPGEGPMPGSMPDLPAWVGCFMPPGGGPPPSTSVVAV